MDMKRKEFDKKLMELTNEMKLVTEMLKEGVENGLKMSFAFKALENLNNKIKAELAQVENDSS